MPAMNGAEAVFTNLVCVARADRALGDDEARLLESYRRALGLRSGAARAILGRRMLEPIHPEEARVFESESLAHLRMLIRLASADGDVAHRERALIEKVARSLGIGPLHLADLEVESAGQVRTRRKLRLAKIIGVAAILVAVVAGLWAARAGKDEAGRSEGRMQERLGRMRIQLDAESERQAALAMERIAESRRRAEAEERALEGRIESLGDEVARAGRRDEELAEVGARLERMLEEGRGDPAVVVEARKLREEIEAWRASADDRARSRAELERLRLELDRIHGVRKTFQSAIADCGASVVLVVASYTLRRGGEEKTRWSSGTGFFVSPDGLIATNKHVVESWKFFPEPRAELADGWVLDESALFIAAWPADSEVLDEHRRWRLDLGFNPKLGNLVKGAVTPDRWVERKAKNESGTWVEGRFHALDPSDLALLEVTMKEPVPVFPLAPDTSEIQPLDPVMVLGFPATFSMLEGKRATTAPALGQVRKVETNLWTTAPSVGGNSGGPILDGRGRVVAVSYKGFEESDSLGAGIPVRHLLDLLPEGRELLRRAKLALEAGQWRAAASFLRLAGQRDAALATEIDACREGLALHYRRELDRARKLRAAGKSDEADALLRVLDFDLAPLAD